METMSLNRNSPLVLKNKNRLRNRIVVPPMASETADTAGFATESTLAHYQRLTQSQPGLLIVEYTYVHSTGRSEENQLGIQSHAHVSGLSQIARLIKNSGAVAGIQLSHGGGKSERNLTGGVLMGPSAIPVPVKDREMEIPDEMNYEQIELWKSAFIEAGARAVQAGFELVELHSAHGYGLNQWLSPITNKRRDAYGKNLAGRSRLLVEIVKALRLNHPRLLISVRIPGQDFSDNGLTTNDSVWLAQELEKAGVDMIHVSSGIGGWRRSPSRTGEGYLVTEASVIQAALSIPVIGVGGIQTGAYIDNGLNSHLFSLAAVGRAILHDPLAWYERVLAP
ncbi:MAG: NADH:flavin oxidoreductase, partial [Pseudobdellovibrio sp.]